MAVVTGVKIGSHSLLSLAEATREIEEWLDQFRILYADAVVVRALRAMAAYSPLAFYARV